MGRLWNVSAFGLALAALPGCGVFGADIDGTWLFMMDYNVTTTGDCVAEDTADGETIVYTGSEGMWVDIFQTGGDQGAVMMDNVLVGEVKSGALRASHEETVGYGADSETYVEEIKAEVTGGTMNGNITSSISRTVDGYSCEQKYKFDAEKNVSSPNDYPEQ